MTRGQNAPQKKWPPCIVQSTTNSRRCKTWKRIRKGISSTVRLVIEGVWIRSQRIGDRLCRHGTVYMTGQIQW